MFIFGKTKVAKEEVYGKEKLIKFGMLMLTIVISKLIDTKINSKYLIG